ncbi:MAG: hypothetical protein H6836_06510 [Planctomycetes bacterium]|nr:hypothetical protein [Planctomycetota bacterium]MCB9889211.1 hypothetical protein [Planctomycetota bacterium]
MTTLVFLMACAPNTTPGQSALLRRLAILTVVIGVVAMVGGVVALAKGRHVWSCGLGLLPLLLAAVLMVWSLARES